MSELRSQIYYWKCDRPATLYGVARGKDSSSDVLLPQLLRFLNDPFPGLTSLVSAGGSGNHHTFKMEHNGITSFVRVEDGPERDTHLSVESRVVQAVAKIGVPVPKILYTDASRQHVPFAVQVIEYFGCPDLNRLYKSGELSLASLMQEIGRSVACWQSVPVEGFGPFNSGICAKKAELRGYHDSYKDYFYLHLERHLGVLQSYGFLSGGECEEVRQVIDGCHLWEEVLNPVLVHKDLALWNILGTADGIQAFIDWDDAIAGDPTDDLSLLACFYSGDIVQLAIEGYTQVRKLPDNFLSRFWLHLLRNMIVKAVIRCGAGYFEDSGSEQFLMSPGQSGRAFRQFTYQRLQLAYRGLRESLPISCL